MKRVDNSRLLFECMLEYRKKSMLTNCFWDFARTEEEVHKKTLFMQELPNGLCLFCKREEFFLLYYFLESSYANEANILDFEGLFIEPIIVEVIGKKVGKMQIENYQKNLAIWAKQGFDKILTRQRFKRNFTLLPTLQPMLRGLKEQEECSQRENPLPMIERYSQEREKEILMFLKGQFDLYTGCIPSGLHLQDGENMDIVYGISNNQKMIGLLHIRQEGKNSEIRHLAVEKTHQNQGLASALLAHFVSSTQSLSCVVWTGQENKIAQKLYQHFGFCEDGYESTVFCLGKKNNET